MVPLSGERDNFSAHYKDTGFVTCHTIYYMQVSPSPHPFYPVGLGALELTQEKDTGAGVLALRF